MKRNTMIAGSYPMIITSGGNPRVNKDLIDDIFLRKYVSLLGELLKVKGRLSDIKITYIGGYSKEENNSRAKLYISAYNYFFNSLGYESLSKSNITILDTDNINEVLESLEKCDLLFLGIGSDRKFASIINKMQEMGINISELSRNKNMVISSICSGSVMSAQRIYGGMYDSYYYGKEPYEYPLNIESLCLNPITMETDFYPCDATKQKTGEFIERYLKPDSNKCAFFACKPNSFFLIGEERIYAYGEIYLFIDGKCLQVEGAYEKADVTDLVALVNEYNKLKNRSVILDDDFYLKISSQVGLLVKESIDSKPTFDERSITYEFRQKENEKDIIKEAFVSKWKEEVKAKLDYLFSAETLLNFSIDVVAQERYKALSRDVIESYNVDTSGDYLEELYLKMNLVSLIKLSYLDYQGYYSDFKDDLYDLIREYVSLNGRLAYYAIDTCGSLFTNGQLKQILKSLEIDAKRPQQLINTTLRQLKLFRKEIKYERS